MNERDRWAYMLADSFTALPPDTREAIRVSLRAMWELGRAQGQREIIRKNRDAYDNGLVTGWLLG